MAIEKLLAIICPNGLGHYRRTMEVLGRVSELSEQLQLEVVCAAWQRKLMQGWEVTERLQSRGRISWIHGVLTPAVTWSASPALYSDGRLLAWIERLRTVPGIADAQLVLSDNMAGVLQLRPDAVLMGSFLWSDVLDEVHPDDLQVQRFVQWERSLLGRHRPPMLCVGDMVTPGVLARTAAVELSWIRQPPDSPLAPTGEDRLVFLCGRSGAFEEAMVAAARALLARGASVAMPAGLVEQLGGHPRAVAFGFSPREFAACRVAVCRPGLGTLHDCLAHRLPMVLIHEAGNPELVHNGRRAAELGFGLYVGEPPPGAALADRIAAFAASDQAGQIRARMGAVRLQGLEQAARWLRRRLAHLTAGLPERRLIEGA